MKAKKFLYRLFKRPLSRWFSNTFCHKYYASIDDMPVYNWVEMHATGDIKHLVKTPGKFIGDPEAAWRHLLNQFYARFGMNKEFKEHLKKVKRLTILICDNALKPDTAKGMHIHILKKELAIFTDKTTQADFSKNVAALSKFVQYRVDIKVTTVAEFYSMVKFMEEAALHFKPVKNGSNKAR